ncbi:MAG: 50S ribosomal protein L15 [Mycoplasmataceae bacterium]|jgi:large subunit ribosomal protein L15|nr:50S ribosomal protein L15 [Mycoplasmataceae bacterium]
MIKLNNLKYKTGSRGHKQKIAGRGPGSGSIRGFKGNKGQGQRSTVNVRIGFEGGQTPLYIRVGKYGFNNKNFATHYNVINIKDLVKISSNEVSRKTLEEAKLIKKNKLPIKIIGSDNVKITKAYSLKVNKITEGAKKSIEGAGGSVELIPLPSKIIPKKVRPEQNSAS